MKVRANLVDDIFIINRMNEIFNLDIMKQLLHHSNASNTYNQQKQLQQQ